MAKCPQCDHKLTTGELICPKCKSLVLPANLLGSETKTVTLPSDASLQFDVHTNALLNKAGFVQFIGDNINLITIPQRGYIGRDDGDNIDTNNLVVYINLSAVGGQQYGVSRLHARVDLDKDSGNFTIMDLSSTNGTFLNGKRLKAFQPHPLSEHDLIELGKFSVEVRYFAYVPAYVGGTIIG